jgi:hypothetical protein
MSGIAEIVEVSQQSIGDTMGKFNSETRHFADITRKSLNTGTNLIKKTNF